jgi:hypothetical protein
MSANLAKAVCGVMAEVKRLAKDARNNHGGYDYVSVDDFKDSIRPLLAKHGLDARITEVSHSIEQLETKSGKSVSAVFTFEIRLRHTSGEQDEPERTTVMLPHTGAQTTGAAKSYALKEWLKGRFLVSTGEKDADADAMPPEQYTGGSISHRATAARMPKREASPIYTQLVTELRKATTTEALTQWKELRQKEIDSLPDDWFSHFKRDWQAHKDELAARVPA